MGLSRTQLAVKPARERVRDWADFAGAEKSWKLGTRTVTISDVEPGDDRVAFSVSVTNTKGKEVYSERHVIINPPIYHPDGGTDVDGKPTYTANVKAILRGIVEEHIR